MMLKPNLIFAATLSAVAIANGVLLSSASATWSGSESANSAANSPQSTILPEKQPNLNPTKPAIAVIILAGLLAAGFFYKNRRYRQAKSVSKIDRFQEEFLCGPLAHLHLSSAETVASSPSADLASSTSSAGEVYNAPSAEAVASTPKTDPTAPRSNTEEVALNSNADTVSSTSSSALEDTTISNSETIASYPSAGATASPSNAQEVGANFNADACVSPASPEWTNSPQSSDKNLLSSDPTSQDTQYLELIDQIVATALKGQIRSKDYIYQKLLQNVSSATSNFFERCLSDRLSTAQSELDSVADAKSLFQTEQPELKKARLTRTIKALQSIQAECERLQQHYRTQAAIAKAVKKIIAASSSDRLATLVQVIDPNQTHVLNFDQLQQLAKSLAASGASSDDPNFKWEIEQLSNGITRGLKSCQQLEGYLVRWIYEPTKSPLGFEPSQRVQKDPWACWAQQVSSPLPQQILYTLASGQSALEWVTYQSSIDLNDWLELAVVFQSLQGGLVSWFEKQPYDSQWGTSASISTFLSFAVVWCQLSNGFAQSPNLNTGKREQLAKGCFQILLQILRAFAHKPYFPLYGGVFALFNGDYLRDTLQYLDEPLRQVEGTQEKARILTLLGYSQLVLGRYEQANSFHQQALEIARQAGDQPCEISNLNHLSRIWVASKNYREAIDGSQRALILARQTGDKLGEANALATLGYSEVFSARQLERIEPEAYETAIAYLKQGLKLSERLGDRQSQVLCCNSLGIAYLGLEQLQTALEYLQQGTKAARFSGDRYLQGLNFAYLAEAYYGFKELGKAVFYSSLGMYILEQIAASEWRQSAGLLTILQGQIGTAAFQKLLDKYHSEIIAEIGVDGYDHLPQLLEQYKRSC